MHVCVISLHEDCKTQATAICPCFITCHLYSPLCIAVCSQCRLRTSCELRQLHAAQASIARSTFRSRLQCHAGSVESSRMALAPCTSHAWYHSCRREHEAGMFMTHEALWKDQICGTWALAVRTQPRHACCTAAPSVTHTISNNVRLTAMFYT
jgi:hypothetical protein